MDPYIWFCRESITLRHVLTRGTGTGPVETGISPVETFEKYPLLTLFLVEFVKKFSKHILF
jgi:hypothetical protein